MQMASCQFPQLAVTMQGCMPGMQMQMAGLPGALPLCSQQLFNVGRLAHMGPTLSAGSVGEQKQAAKGKGARSGKGGRREAGQRPTLMLAAATAGRGGCDPQAAQPQQLSLQRQLQQPHAVAPQKLQGAPAPEERPAAGRAAAADDQEANAAAKGVISLLQEFVQCSRQFHAPQHRAILQWTFDNRMADFTTLEFRGTVAFVLDGVPHHVAGAWYPSKKQAQRDTAERALAFFVGRWGEQLLAEQDGIVRPSPADGKKPDTQVLDTYCGSYAPCGGVAPSWSHVWEDGRCKAVVEIELLGVAHKFAGDALSSEAEARADTARRVLWYLQCPGYEAAFSPDPRAPAVNSKDIPLPPTNWAKDEAEGSALQIAERKTVLMRVQNKLQQAFAKRLRPGQGVWEWTFETDEQDKAWPPLCRAIVNIPVAGQSFAGPWARGQRDAQIEACGLVTDFLSSAAGQASAGSPRGDGSQDGVEAAAFADERPEYARV